VSIHSTGAGDLGPLVVKPRQAELMLSCSHKRLYELLAAGELQSFRDGSSRKIVVESIREYIARGLAASAASSPKARKAAGRELGDHKNLTWARHKGTRVATAQQKGEESDSGRVNTAEAAEATPQVVEAGAGGFCIVAKMVQAAGGTGSAKSRIG